MSDRRAEAGVLDARIRAAIDAYALDDAAFVALARDLVAHQLRWNAPYAAYARTLGIDVEHVPATLDALPFVPARAFKDARLSTLAPGEVGLWFETSGTTAGTGGRHEFETSALYDAALLAGFDRALLDDGARLRYLLLTPDRPHSSLGHMMELVARERGDGATGRYLHGDALDVDAFLRDARAAIADDVPVLLATTAFALVALLDALRERGERLALPAGSRIMETGGFKGRTRVVERDVLYAQSAERLGIPEASIVAEYGMTELSSQYYDAPFSRRARTRVKAPPPWLRPIVVDPDGRPVAPGIVGAIRHVDLANRASVVAIETEDLGALVDGGLVLLGREAGAELRGCSLDAEDLLTR